MNAPDRVAHDDFERTRQSLSDGTFLAHFRSNPPPGASFRSDEQLQDSLVQALQVHDPAQDLHVFGYGSLMWNPAIDALQGSVALVRGWRRDFCLRVHAGRGSLERPGAMLALDRGGACKGVLYRIAAAKVQTELSLLWRREMLSGAYDWRRVEACVGTEKIPALTFVVRRDHERYIGRKSNAYLAHLIRTGEGALGSSRAYFDATLATLARLRIRDAGMQRLQQVVQQADAQDSLPRA